MRKLRALEAVVGTPRVFWLDYKSRVLVGSKSPYNDTFEVRINS